MADSSMNSLNQMDESVEHLDNSSARKPYKLPKWYEAETNDYTPEEFEEMFKLYDETMEDIKEGEVIPGQVVAVGGGEVVIDIGFKSEGSIPMSEFPAPDEIKVGDSIEVFLESLEDREGQLMISKKKADFMKVWGSIKDAYESGTVMEGLVLKRIKGGMAVDLLGVEAFLPGSQVSLKHTPNLEVFVGQQLRFKIIKLNKSRRNIVVSHRKVLEEEREVRRKETMAEIKKGQVRHGVVKNITDFGAFVDLGGIDGLLHISDMSWGRLNHPSEILKIGQEISVAVLDYDRERGRVSLGLKQLKAYPWTNVEGRLPVGSVVSGRVVNIREYGAFVELEEGVEGLIHISEMSWGKHISHPSKVVRVGQDVDVKILSVDSDGEKIGLSIKQTLPDPWHTLGKKYTEGMVFRGRVRNITHFGAFIELEDGIDGLLHISDLSWVKRFEHPDELVRKGEEIDVIVLGIDQDRHRISLGLKQLTGDPWSTIEDMFATGSETTGTVVRLLGQGVVVDLPEGFEGFVPISHLNHPNIKLPADAFEKGDRLPLKVIQIDVKRRRMVLSVKAFFKDKEQTEIDRYIEEHPTKVSREQDSLDLETGGKGQESETER